MEERLTHLTPNEQVGLAAIVDRLRQRYGDDLLRVVLFGSKARGDFDDECDLDVLVVVRAKDYWRCWREITDLTSHLFFEIGVSILAMVRDEARCEWWAAHRAPIYNSIQREGIEVWTKPNGLLSQFA